MTINLVSNHYIYMTRLITILCAARAHTHTLTSSTYFPTFDELLGQRVGLLGVDLAHLCVCMDLCVCVCVRARAVCVCVRARSVCVCARAYLRTYRIWLRIRNVFGTEQNTERILRINTYYQRISHVGFPSSRLPVFPVFPSSRLPVFPVLTRPDPS